MSEKLYTAVGKYLLKNQGPDKRYPVVMVGEREYILGMDEMLLWSQLNWRILSEKEAEKLYHQKENEFGLREHLSFENCLSRLVMRGLVEEGIGECQFDSLYNLLANLCVIPISENILLKTLSFVKLTFFSHVPYAFTKKVFRKDRRTDNEKKVIRLSRQALLSSAEIIKCVSIGKYDFANEDEIVDTLYRDKYTTADNIAFSCRNLSVTKDTVKAISDLYLRKQIIFERT